LHDGEGCEFESSYYREEELLVIKSQGFRMAIEISSVFVSSLYIDIKRINFEI
jgi:hypothetical protein